MSEVNVGTPLRSIISLADGSVATLNPKITVFFEACPSGRRAEENLASSSFMFPTPPLSSSIAISSSLSLINSFSKASKEPAASVFIIIFIVTLLASLELWRSGFVSSSIFCLESLIFVWAVSFTFSIAFSASFLSA